MEREERSDRFTAIEDQYADYEVYDRDGEKIGKVDDLFLDEHDQPEYVGVKMGFLGLEGTSLIPWEATRVNEGERRIEVSADKAQVKEGPSFNDDEDITPDYEERVYSHYGLQRSQTGGERGGYGEYYGDDEAGKVGPGMREGDTETGEFRGHSEADEGVHQSHGSDLEDEDELRVQRTEEELRAGTREREAGRMNVRKRVRTDREQVRVPKRREEVSVERVPVDEEGTGAEIGDDEVTMPIVEEEIVVDKRPVVKEEIRVRKDVVDDEEIVEEDVRKEEVDVDDQTTTTRGRGRETDLDDQTRGR
ncbi:MAG TPA: PRC and DUF2382 domain-containing protein [Rubrobacteraceae bacterium]|nr:PRC and DUF2382 domain-containing protein [Rubrobacteraceae bacterium]